MNKSMVKSHPLKIGESFEIERKYLVENLPPDFIPAGTKSYEILQVYLKRPDREGVECRVRKKTCGTRSTYFYTEKAPTSMEGVRKETEKEIGAELFDALMRVYSDTSCIPIEKTRYEITRGPYVLQIDIYHGRLAGLVTLEVEFSSKENCDAFLPPEGIILIDVTSDKRYSNRTLSEKGIPSL